MNKKGLIGAILFVILVLGVLVFFYITINSVYKENQSFCENAGFSSYEKKCLACREGICIKIEDGYRVEKKYDKCGNEFCFAKGSKNVQ